jgi:IS5 family transposase
MKLRSQSPGKCLPPLVKPVYHKSSSKGGLSPVPLEVMLKIHLLQQWFTLSGPLMGEMLIDPPCFRRFAGIETMEGRILDEITILDLRHLPEEHRHAEQILEGVKQVLSEKCTRWPRASNGSTASQKASPMECAATLELMPHLAWSTLLRAPPQHA